MISARNAWALLLLLLTACKPAEEDNDNNVYIAISPQRSESMLPHSTLTSAKSTTGRTSQNEGSTSGLRARRRTGAELLSAPDLLKAIDRAHDPTVFVEERIDIDQNCFAEARSRKRLFPIIPR